MDAIECCIVLMPLFGVWCWWWLQLGFGEVIYFFRIMAWKVTKLPTNEDQSTKKVVCKKHKIFNFCEETQIIYGCALVHQLYNVVYANTFIYLCFKNLTIMFLLLFFRWCLSQNWCSKHSSTTLQFFQNTLCSVKRKENSTDLAW